MNFNCYTMDLIGGVFMAQVSMRMDDNLKKEAEVLFEELGLSMSSAFTIFVKQSLREGGIPFEISLNNFNNETLQAMSDIKQGKNLSKSFDNVEDLMRDLNA